jgi:hypothetical protein
MNRKVITTIVGASIGISGFYYLRNFDFKTNYDKSKSNLKKMFIKNKFDDIVNWREELYDITNTLRNPECKKMLALDSKDSYLYTKEIKNCQDLYFESFHRISDIINDYNKLGTASTRDVNFTSGLLSTFDAAEITSTADFLSGGIVSPKITQFKHSVNNSCFK